LGDLQKKLLPKTTFGRQIQEQSKDVEAAIQALQSAGNSLTREKLLEMVIKAPNQTQLSVLVSLGRPGMDYEFFTMLSDRVDRARGEDRERLTILRNQLLEMTQTIDRQMQERLLQAKKNITTIMQAKDIQGTMIQNLSLVDEFFVQAFNEEMEAARKTGDLEKISKLHQIEEVVEKASAPPPEVELIQELLEVADSETELVKKLQENKAEITPEFMDILSNLLVRTESGEDAELKARLNKIFGSALQLTMSANLK